MSEKGYLTWEAADRGTRLRIPDLVVRGISSECMRGFGATRRRGAEAGGLLFGRRAEGPGNAFVIEEFVPVPCQYAHGPSYVLSDNDHEAFARAIRTFSQGANQPVGFYRSHTRDGMEPDSSDAALWARHLGGVLSGVILLLKPFATRAPVARVVPVERGEFSAAEADSEEFTFVFAPGAERTASAAAAGVEKRFPAVAHRADEDRGTKHITIVAGDRPQSPAPAVVSAAAAEVRAVEPSAPQTENLSQEIVLPVPSFGVDVSTQDRNWKLPLAVCAAIFAALAWGVVAGYKLGRGDLYHLLGWGPQSAAAADPYALGLQARTEGNSILIAWSRTSALAQQAVGGRLTLQSAAGEQSTQISATEMRYGTILALPGGPEVRVRLEAELPASRSVSETVVWRGTVPTPAEPQAQAQAQPMQPSK